jgi:hypothetical protein
MQRAFGAAMVGMGAWRAMRARRAGRADRVRASRWEWDRAQPKPWERANTPHEGRGEGEGGQTETDAVVRIAGGGGGEGAGEGAGVGAGARVTNGASCTLADAAPGDRQTACGVSEARDASVAEAAAMLERVELDPVQ